MSKKIFIIAIVLILVGTIGSVWSGLNAIPSIINFGFEKQEEYSSEHTIYEKDVKINNIKAFTQMSDIEIRKHDKKTIKVTKIGTNQDSNYEFNVEGNSLEVKEQDKKNEGFDIKNFEDLFNRNLENMFSYYKNQIIIYVPNDVDINVATDEGSLIIMDDIYLNNVSFTTRNGNFVNGVDASGKNNLEKLNIKSANHLNLSSSDILGIKNINLDVNSLAIRSNENDIFIQEIEKVLPETLNITSNNNDEGYVDIDVDIPVAKELNIDTPSTNVSMRLPIMKYKINFDLKSSEGIDLLENNVLNQETKDKYQEKKEIKGLLSDEQTNSNIECNVNANAGNINLY